MFRNLQFAIVFSVAGLICGTQAMGLVIDGSGNVTDWGITPFADSNGSGFGGGAFFTIENDYSPIDYPGGIGHVPSPGGATGEKFDMEQMHLRLTEDGLLQILLVHSGGLSAVAASQTWYLGDLFININGTEYAVITQDVGRGYAAGDVYEVAGMSDVDLLQAGGASYLGNNTSVANDYGPNDVIRNIAGPWQLKGGLDLNPTTSATLLMGSHDFGGSEGVTQIIEYTMYIGDLSMDESLVLNAHMTWGCGNDVIEVNGEASNTVPEPASVALMGLGMALIGYRPRKS